MAQSIMQAKRRHTHTSLARLLKSRPANTLSPTRSSTSHRVHSVARDMPGMADLLALCTNLI